jgi:hypothetical protein
MVGLCSIKSEASEERDAAYVINAEESKIVNEGKGMIGGLDAS